MAKPTAPRKPRLAADQRIWDLGYHRGYTAGRGDGCREGEEAFQAWLLKELTYLAADINLELRHDVSTPLQVLAAVREIVAEGQPVLAEDDDDGGK
jgi:hypothetical protein